MNRTMNLNSPIFTKQDSELMIDYDKKSLCKSQFFFKQKMGLSEETPQIARIQNEITDIWQSDVTIRTLIDPVKNGMYFKVKKFVNRLKNLSNLNSSSLMQRL